MSNTNKLFGKPRVKAPMPSTVNRDGYPAYERSLREQLLQVLCCNVFQNTFYSEKRELIAEAEALIRGGVHYDAEFTAKAIAYAREYGFMRTAPLMGLALLSKERPDLFRKAFPNVVKIPSDMQDFLTILGSMRDGSQGGRAVKEMMNKRLNRLTEYEVLKYGGAGRMPLKDIMRTCHPRCSVPFEPRREGESKKDYNARLKIAKAAADKRWALGEYVLHGEVPHGFGKYLPQIMAFKALAKADSRDAAGLVESYKLPHECVTGTGNVHPMVWAALARDMPVTATLRHVNTLDRHGVLEGETLERVCARLSNPIGIKNAKVLPFQLLLAFNNISNPRVKDALRMAIEHSVANLPQLMGTTLVAVDVSGSMGGWEYHGKSNERYEKAGIKPDDISSLFALSLYKTGTNVDVIAFGNSVYNANLSRVDSVLSQAHKLKNRNDGTRTGCVPEYMLKNRRHVDNLVLITDEQQSLSVTPQYHPYYVRPHGEAFYSLLMQYRQQVNKYARCFIVNIGAETGSLAPKEDPLTYMIYGWTDTVPRLISQVTRGGPGMTESIDQLVLTGEYPGQ